MKVLVVPNVHLKPWIIETADQMMEKHAFDNAVFLGDFADDWEPVCLGRYGNEGVGRDLSR